MSQCMGLLKPISFLDEVRALWSEEQIAGLIEQSYSGKTPEGINNKTELHRVSYGGSSNTYSTDMLITGILLNMLKDKEKEPPTEYSLGTHTYAVFLDILIGPYQNLQVHVTDTFMDPILRQMALYRLCHGILPEVC